MRADARRNHGQLLSAALEVVLELGPQAPLGEVAARAGVGIGTLYRRFADRGALLTAVVADALERSRNSARAALECLIGDDGFRERLGRSAYARAQRDWSPAATEAKFVRIYRKLVDRGPNSLASPTC